MGDINLQKIINYSLSKYKCSEIHGLSHWARVAKNGLRIANHDEDVNKRVVILFAFLHDHMRQNDHMDDQHGPRAAQALYNISETLLSGLSEEEFDLLHTACELHTESDGTGDPTVDACFDADRLDLGRVGITPDPDRMCTEVGQILAQRIQES